MVKNKLWIEKDQKVFLTNFEGAEMSKDTDGKYSSTADFWRKKTYTKAEEMVIMPRDREFSDPYQVAQAYCGGNWNDHNAPYAFQVGKCNLNCFWCFASDDTKNLQNGGYFSGEDIVKIYAKENPDRPGTIRYTGGEPFLAPDSIVNLAKSISLYNKNNPTKRIFLWIDTNLLGDDYDRVVTELIKTGTPFGIIACIKGFDDEDFKFNTREDSSALDDQFENARVIINALQSKPNNGELFFYVPEITQDTTELYARNMISSFIDRMRRDIHELAPLRTTVLIIKEYPSNTEKISNYMVGLDRFESRLTRIMWFDIVDSIYSVDLTWLPQHQINIK